MGQTSTNPDVGHVEQIEFNGALANRVYSEAARPTFVAGLRLLWDQRRLLFRVTAGGLLAATLLAFLIPSRFQSTTRLMPPDNQSGSGMAIAAALAARGATLGTLPGDLLGLKSSSPLFVGVLWSRTVQDHLIERFDLRRVYRTRTWGDARSELADSTQISEDRKSGIIALTVTDKSPQRAAALAGAYAEELDRLLTALTTSAAHRERIFIEERLKVVKEELNAAAKEFSQFASKNTAIDIKEQGRALVEVAAALQGQLIAARSELEGLKQIYTDNNVRVRAVKARVAELQRQLEKAGGKEADGIGSSSQEGESPYPSIRKLPLLGVTYADLYRRIKIQETVFEMLTQQYELARVQEAKEIPSVRVLDAANVPEEKAAPSRPLIIFLGSFFSFGVGVAWVLGRARWEEADPRDPRRVFAEEVFRTLKAQKPWASRNDFRLGSVASGILGRLKRRKSQHSEEK